MSAKILGNLPLQKKLHGRFLFPFRSYSTFNTSPKDWNVFDPVFHGLSLMQKRPWGRSLHVTTPVFETVCTMIPKIRCCALFQAWWLTGSVHSSFDLPFAGSINTGTASNLASNLILRSETSWREPVLMNWGASPVSHVEFGLVLCLPTRNLFTSGMKRMHFECSDSLG